MSSCDIRDPFVQSRSPDEVLRNPGSVCSTQHRLFDAFHRKVPALAQPAAKAASSLCTTARLTVVWTLQINEFKGSIIMLAADTNAPIALDVTTLIISGAAITLLLGVFLLSA